MRFRWIGSSEVKLHVRVIVFLLLLTVGTAAVLLLGRLRHGEWLVGDGLVISAMLTLFILPGGALVVARVQSGFLFAVGLLALLGSIAAGLLAAQASNDAQAGINVLITPFLAIVLALTLASIDENLRRRRPEG